MQKHYQRGNTDIGFFRNIGRRRYTEQEIMDLIGPSLDDCHVSAVYLNPPEVFRGRETWRDIRITYIPSDDFTMDDYYGMQLLSTLFPPGQCSVFGLFRDSTARRKVDGLRAIY